MSTRDNSDPDGRSESRDVDVCALALMSCPHIGASRLERALKEFGGAGGAFEALQNGEAIALSEGRDRVTESEARAVARYLQLYDFEATAARLHRLGARVVGRGSSGYPDRLSRSPSAPPFLAMAGRLNIPETPAVAIVGTRRATATGIEVATRIALDLAACGFVVVSGMAKGIDAAAHRGSLEASTKSPAGVSVAVLGCGLDVVYPRRNAELYRRLAAGGVIVSQYGLGAPPEKWRFPERNRTIAGLSCAVLVVESYATGGALSTVAAANEMGREVLAVPGSVMNPAAEGTNQLIWDGAVPVRSAGDVVEYLSQVAGAESPLDRGGMGEYGREEVLAGEAGETPGRMPTLQLELLSLLADGEPRSLSELSSYCGVCAARVIDDLVALAARGLVVPFGQERFVATGAARAPTRRPYWR